MAKVYGDYNPDNVEPGMDFEPFTGTELAQIIASDEKGARSNEDNRILELRWKVCEGEPHAGREVFQNINYIHSSAQAQTIGQQQLKAICEAVGHEGHLDDTEVLHNTPCRVTFGLSKTTPEYPNPKTEVKAVKPANAGAPETKPQERTAAPSKPVPAANKAAASGSAPWKKNKTAA
ncbi:MAG: DUF669 domain-containing protein [Xanthobacteraceae bacterium]